jgi:hypothetical protein
MTRTGKSLTLRDAGARYRADRSARRRRAPARPRPTLFAFLQSSDLGQIPLEGEPGFDRGQKRARIPPRHERRR